MNGISVKKRAKMVSTGEQKRLKVLIRDFGILDESRKDYIRELTRKLVDIHCGGEFLGKGQGNEPGLQRGIAGLYLG